ncbi:protein kinase family protein [Nocardioides montaniterrae]
MEQGTLRELKADDGTDALSAKRSLAILRAVSEALFPMHAAGSAYGAFGPDSIIIDGDNVRLADTATYDEKYAAPELRAGGEPTPASDAFSYASLAHRLLAGDAPAFDPRGVPLPIVERHPGFPAFAAEAITRALQVDPAKRPLPKVLDTLLQVVPIDRWPATADRVIPTPEPAAAPEPAVDQAAQRPARDLAGDARSADQIREERNEEFRRALSPGHAVPRIAWNPADHSAQSDSRPLIDWTATDDPTRPSHEVPEIRWSPKALHGGDPLTDELPVVEGPAPVDPIGEAIEEAIADPVEAEPSPVVATSEVFAAEAAEEDSAAEDEAPEDSTTEDEVSEDSTTDDEATEDEQAEDEPTDDEAADDEATEPSEERVRSTRRRSKGLTADQVQKIALAAILVLVLIAGLIFALTHRDGPKYDPTLHGASRSLTHSVPVQE